MKIFGDENNEFLLKELGRRVQKTRIASKMSQKDFSEKTGLSKGTICRIESGQSTTMENFLKVLRALDLLQGLDVLIPEQELRPSDLLEASDSKWKRVTEQRKKENAATDWKWGED